jgi:Trk K+ transport system NAD-binding subunit
VAHGRISITEFDIPPDFATKRILELGLPKSALIVAIERPGAVIIPRGSTKVKPGDRIVAASLADGVADIAAVFEVESPAT